MRTPRSRVFPAALCILLFAAATPASAEWLADLYGGSAHTPNSDVTLVVRPGGADADHTFHDLKWDSSGVLGARAGYWFESAPWYGVGLDVFRFGANLPKQTVDTTISGVTAPATLQKIDFAVTAVAFDLVRLRCAFLAGPQFPKGRLQPYVTAGPALFRTTVTNKENGELTTEPATDTTTGYKVGAGLSWELVKNVAIFGEYRYTHFHSEPVLRGSGTGSPIPIRFDLNTHHAVAGLSFRF